ncbi:MAG: DNA replication and repair protein RecF [Bdellovibrionales bacterium]|nr:DNA replication and repair protein RecF [Bdellovibrionales bacterium]
MKLKKLSIQNIRILSDIVLECDSGIHYIYGQNAQGKTSILEAISILSHLRSFRDSDLHSILKSRENYGAVRGEFEIEPGINAELKVELIQGPARFEKRAYINHKLSKSAVDYFGMKLQRSPVQFHAIVLNPTSTDLVRGEPSLRRSYLNQVISSEDPTQLDILKKYQKVADQKNALLKDDRTFDLQLLRILNENIATLGAQVLYARYNLLSRMANPVIDFLQKIAPQQKPVFLAYKNSDKSAETLQFNRHFYPPTVKILEANLHQKLEEILPVERARRSSLIGPHRDDIKFQVGESDSNRGNTPDLVDVGSQGEIRSALLSLKLAELEEFKRQTGVQPVLLIDDFSSELDATRRGFLLNYLKDSDLQIFVTSTEILDSPGKLIQMNRGRIA